MTWWCAATRLPWSWSPRAYPGVWAFMATLAVAGVVAVRRTGLYAYYRHADDGVFRLWQAVRDLGAWR